MGWIYQNGGLGRQPMWGDGLNGNVLQHHYTQADKEGAILYFWSGKQIPTCSKKGKRLNLGKNLGIHKRVTFS